MRGLTITIIIVLVAIVVAGIFIFSGGDEQAVAEDQNPGNQAGETNNTQQSPTTGTQPQTYNIEIKNYAFTPSAITIKTGDAIMWTNSDSVRHTVTSDSGTEFNSDPILRGESYSHTFNKAGTYSYHCTPHPYMKGTITVE